MAEPDESQSVALVSSPLLAAANAVWERRQGDTERLDRLRQRYERLVCDIESDLPGSPFEREIAIESWTDRDHGNVAYEQRQIDEATATNAQLTIELPGLKDKRVELVGERANTVRFENRTWMARKVRGWLGEQHRSCEVIDEAVNAVTARINSVQAEIQRNDENIQFSTQARDAYRADGETLDEWKAELALWAKGHTAEFALEDKTLKAIAQRRAVLRSEVTALLPELKADGAEIELVVNLVYFADTYGKRGQTVEAVVLEEPDSPVRAVEQTAVSRDIEEFLPIQRGREDAALSRLRGLWQKLADEFAAPGDTADITTDFNNPNSYLSFVSQGAFAAPGQQDPRPPTSLDRHYRGTFGDDWRHGVMAEIGPSGTDEESYDEMDRASTWKRARDMVLSEFDAGQKTIPYGRYDSSGEEFIDRAYYSARDHSGLDSIIFRTIDRTVMQARDHALDLANAIDQNLASEVARVDKSLAPHALEM